MSILVAKTTFSHFEIQNSGIGKILLDLIVIIGAYQILSVCVIPIRSGKVKICKVKYYDPGSLIQYYTVVISPPLRSRPMWFKFIPSTLSKIEEQGKFFINWANILKYDFKSLIYYRWAIFPFFRYDPARLGTCSKNL